MADPRTFTLIGEFKDGITPELAKINKQISDLKANFAGVGSRKNSGFRGATKEIGKLVSANKNLTKSFRGVQSSVSTTTGTLKKYITVLNKATAANNKFQKSGGNMGGSAFARNMREANREAERYLRTLQQINRSAPRFRRPPAPAGGGFGGRSGRGGGGSGPGGFHMAEFGFAYTLGNTLSNTITGAITKGFSIGVDMMQKPFQYFANALAERIRDEQSDIKAAGGIFAVSKRQKDPLVKTMDEAMEFTQENNKLMAELAAALPGTTQDYIETGKRLSDSIARIVSSDRVKAIEYANQLRREEGKQTIVGEDRAAAKQAYTTLIGQITKQTTLAGLGGGARSTMGAYGLPQLTERMLTQDQVSMGQFQRYSAIFKDPLVMDALNRFIPKVNATTKGTMERFKILDELFKEVVPPEMIRKFERSSEGIMEMFNTAIFGPETGIFGIGRKMEGLGKAMDDYGRYIKVLEDGTRKIVTSIDEASDVDLSLFDLFRDILANVSIVLGPIITNLSLIFDPLNKVASLLTDARHATGKFLLSFERYTKGFQDMAKEMSEADRNIFVKIPAVLRGSLAAINNLFADFGIISEADFKKNAKELMSLEFDPGKMIKEFLDQFLKSDLAKQIGNLIGSIVGTVLSEVANVTGFVSGRIAGSGKLFEGLQKGFNDAKGFEAMEKIFSDVFESLFKLLIELAKRIPLKGYLMGGFMLVLPAVAQGIGMWLASNLLKLPAMLAKHNIAQSVLQAVKGAFTRVKPVTATPAAAATTITDPSRLLPAAKGTTQAALPASNLAKPLAKGGGWFGGMLKNLAKFGTTIKNFWKVLTLPMKTLGKLNLGFGALTGAIEFVSKLLSGGDIFEALGAGAGATIGSIIGGALLGPLGAVVGGWIGSMKPVTDFFEGAFRGIWQGITDMWDALAPIGEGLIGVLGSIWNILTEWIPALGQLGSNTQQVNDVASALKIILTPFVGFLNGLAFAIQALQLGLLHLDKWINKTFQWGDRQGRIQADIDKVTANMQKTAQRQADWNANVFSPVVDPDKKEPGKAPGKAPAQAPVAVSPVFAPAAQTPLGPPPVPQVPEEVKATAQNTLELNTKSAQQITQGAQTHQTTQEVKENTNKANGVLGNIKAGIISLSNKLTGISQILGQAQASMTATYMLLASGSLSVRTPDMAGMGGMFGMGGGGGGMALGSGYGSAGGAIAGKLGDFMKSTGGAPGSIHEHPAHGGVKGKHSANSYHYQGRAIDIGAYAHEQAGVISRIQQFNQKMGVKPVEFLHAGNDPAGHSDHVHVAYALGKGNPAFFSSQRAAENWEASMAGRMNVRSVTGNTMEGFGGNSVGDIYVTVNAGSTTDPDQLAYMVAERIQAAVGDAVNANIFV